MGVHGLVEWLIGGDDLRVGLKAQGKEQGVIHTPAVLHGQAVRRHEQGRAGGGRGEGELPSTLLSGFRRGARAPPENGLRPEGRRAHQTRDGTRLRQRQDHLRE